MKKLVHFGLFCATLMGSTWAKEFPIEEVLGMAQKDDQRRKEWVVNRDIAPIREQEMENTTRLKEILSQYGLPNDYESDEVVEAIQQLVLHSSDLPFQVDFLSKIPQSNDLWEESIDTLTDRVLLRQGKPQRYGTHFYHQDEQILTYPIENPEQVDALREEMNEPPLSVYLTCIQAFETAFKNKSDADLYCNLFNLMHEFYGKTSEYLYYASFEPNHQPEDKGMYFAFEDPAFAVAFALSESPSVYLDALYERGEDGYEYLKTQISPISEDGSTLLTNTPIYVYIVPRDGYQPHEEYGASFQNRLYSSPLFSTPVKEIPCDSALEVLYLGGALLKMPAAAGGEYSFKDTIVREKLQNYLNFDATLENENFPSM